MMVRSLKAPDVQRTTYIAHGGGLARMIMTSAFLQGIEFLAHALLPAGNTLEEHTDAVEEIYYILKGAGTMQVDEDRREVAEADAVWIPVGAAHSLENHTNQQTEILVIAAYPRDRR